MSELAQRNGKGYDQALSEVLSLMLSVLKGASSDRKSLAQAWLMVLRPRVPQQWLVPTCEWFMLHATFFPTPAEFIDKATYLAERSDLDDRLALTTAREKSERLAIEARICRELKAAGVDMSTTYTPSDVAALLSGAPSRFGGEE